MRNKIIVMGFVVSGIALNFLKEVILSYYYGANHLVDQFRVASYLPYALFQSLGSVLVGLYLPKLINHEGRIETSTFLITRVSIIITFLGVILAPWYSPYLAPGFSMEELSLLISATQICWLGFFIASITFHYRIVMQLKDNTILVSSTSFALAVSFIFFLFLFRYIIPKSSFILSLSFVSSIIFVFIIHYFYLKKTVSLMTIFKGIFSTTNTKSPITTLVLISSIFSYGLMIMPRVLDRSFVSKYGEGYISLLDYAYSIYTAMALVFGTTSVILLAHYIAENCNKKRVLMGIISASKYMLIMCVFSAVIIYFNTNQIISLVFERGSFSTDNTNITSDFLAAIIIALPIVVLNMLLIQTLLGRGNIKEIILTSVIKLLVKYFSMISLSSINPFIAVGGSLILSEVVYTCMLAYIILKHNHNKLTSTQATKL